MAYYKGDLEMDVSIITVAPGKAEQLLKLRWEKQRNIRKSHVDFLASEMVRGRYSPSTIELVDIVESSRTVLIDGQHALSAIIESGKAQQMILKKSVARSESEVPYLFSRIDVQRRRNLGDSITAFDMPDNVPFSRWYIKKVASAIKFINNEFGVKIIREVAIEDSIKDLIDWADDANEYIRIYETSTGSHEKQRFVNRAVLSVGLATFRYVDDQEKVREFWRGFIHGTNLSQYDPRLIGRNKYFSITVQGGGMTLGRPMWSANLISRLVAWSWNMYYLGEERTKVNLRNRNKTLPIELSGTKYYTGRQV